MSIFCIGQPPGKAVPKSEYNFKMDEERFFFPGELHSGDYILDVYAYSVDEIDKMEVKYLTPEIIISSYTTALDSSGNFKNDVFTDSLAEAETFICDNTPHDPCFCYLNECWLTHGVAQTPEEFVKWAKSEIAKEALIHYADNTILYYDGSVREAFFNSSRETFDSEVITAVNKAISSAVNGDEIFGDTDISYFTELSQKMQENSEFAQNLYGKISDRLYVKHKKIDKARQATHEMGLPYDEYPYDPDEEFDPFAFDPNRMSIEDYKRLHELIKADKQNEQQNNNRATYSTSVEADVNGEAKLKEYSVTITETLQKTVAVKAQSRAEAEERVEQMWNNGEYILDADSFVLAEFDAEECEEHKKTKPLLPESCYGVLQSTGQIIIIKRGESGYFPTDIPAANKREAQEIVDEYNSMRGISKAQAAAMSAGSMFGWDVPAADPENYDANGTLKKDTGTYIEISSECADEEIEPEM